MKIDPNSAQPIYLQIIEYLKMAVLSGRYRDGDRIPPVREMAVLLRINPNTVAKAYKIMQDEGLLSSRPGGGSFIVAPDSAAFAMEREKVVAEDIARLLAKATSLGISPERLLELLEKAIEEERK